jgi:hypothetical protein
VIAIFSGRTPLRSTLSLPLGTDIHEFTALKGIPGAVRDAGPDF